MTEVTFSDQLRAIYSAHVLQRSGHDPSVVARALRGEDIDAPPPDAEAPPKFAPGGDGGAREWLPSARPFDPNTFLREGFEAALDHRLNGGGDGRAVERRGTGSDR